MLARNGAVKWNDRIGRRLKLYDLHVLLTVAEMGSMGKAAARLAISQPSVSKSMANIEHIVGVRLLDRTTTGVELTAYGQALVRRGMGAFDELRQGINDIELLADPTAGEVRVGSPETVTCGLLSTVLARFSCQYPRVIVSVFSANNLPKQFTLLHERDVDLLIGGIPDQLAAQDVKAEILYEDRPLIVSGGKNRFASRGKIELEDLVDEPWLLAPASIFSSVLAQAFLSKGLAFPRGGVRSFSTYQRLSLLATDHFIGAECNSLLQFTYDRFPLKALPVDFAARSFRVAILTLKDRMLNPIVHTFMDCVREVARSMRQGASGGARNEFSVKNDSRFAPKRTDSVEAY